MMDTGFIATFSICGAAAVDAGGLGLSVRSNDNNTADSADACDWLDAGSSKRTVCYFGTIRCPDTCPQDRSSSCATDVLVNMPCCGAFIPHPHRFKPLSINGHCRTAPPGCDPRFWRYGLDVRFT